MLVKILIDNITKDKLQKEWGLAIYIEYNGHKLLLDTGATGKFIRNAEAMGIDLKQVEFGVLSHAHFDHSDGLEAFFKENAKASFYLREGSGENCYGKKWIFHEYVGIHKGYLTRYRDRIVYAAGDYEIVPGVTLIPHKTTGLDQKGKRAGMYVRRNGKWVPDSFSHEQSLVFDTDRGLVIFNSCSHGGADNIIREVADTYPEKKIYALIGGFHLYASSKAEILTLAEGINKTGIEKVYTGHCTGKRAFRILKGVLGERAEQMYTGMELEI